MTKTYDVVRGLPVPDVTHLTREEAIVRKDAVQSRLAEVHRGGAWLLNRAAERERELLKRENDALAAHLRSLKEKQKAENMRRNFAGLHSPLWDACRDEFDAETVARLEKRALARLAEREARKSLT